MSGWERGWYRGDDGVFVFGYEAVVGGVGVV